MEKTRAGKVHESGFALTLGLSVFVHAAVLGTVSVFAFQDRPGPAATAGPALEVIWVSTAEPARGQAAGSGSEPEAVLPSKARSPAREILLPPHPRVVSSPPRPLALSHSGTVSEPLATHGSTGEESDVVTLETAPAEAEALGAEPMPAMSSEPATEPAALDPVPGLGAPSVAAEDRIAALSAGEEGRDAGFVQKPDTSKSGSEIGDPSSTSLPIQLSRPEYPTLSRRLGEEGTVLLAMRLGPDGQVSEARVERSSGFARLDGAALAAARAERMDRAEADRLIRIAYTFRLEE